MIRNYNITDDGLTIEGYVGLKSEVNTHPISIHLIL